jgi:hypothetical protein
MRLYRKRCREGIRLVRIPLRVTDIDSLIQVGRLGEDQRHDAEAIGAAVLGLFEMALEEIRDVWPGARPAPMRPPPVTTAAERMRLYRKRRREGLQYVRIPLHVTHIDRLIQVGLLGGDECHDAEAIGAAVLVLFEMALEEIRDVWPGAWARSR